MKRRISGVDDRTRKKQSNLSPEFHIKLCYHALYFIGAEDRFHQTSTRRRKRV